MCCPSLPAGHVVSSSQWAVSRRDLCPSSKAFQSHVIDLVCDPYEDVSASESKGDLMCNARLGTVTSNATQRATGDDGKDYNKGWHWKQHCWGDSQRHSTTKHTVKMRKLGQSFLRTSYESWVTTSHTKAPVPLPLKHRGVVSLDPFLTEPLWSWE